MYGGERKNGIFVKIRIPVPFLRCNFGTLEPDKKRQLFHNRIITMELAVIQNKIYEIRGQRVMIDSGLAALYQVETKYLKRTVNRNIQRFPPDFMFELTPEEWEFLRCNFGTSSWGGTRYLPYAFTEQDLSEDTRRSLDDIYIALSELAAKNKQGGNERPKIGYVK